MIQWRKYIAATVFVTGAVFSADAQVVKTPYKHYSSEIVRDIRLDALLDTIYQRHNAQPTIKGYRIQLFTGAERLGALDTKSDVQKNLPGADVYIIYQQPYFKVRVGDFRTQAEAQQMYHQLLPIFPKAFLVPDDINLPQIK